VTQEVFVRIYQQLGTYAGRRAIYYNLALDGV
jgi:hypothetical protein